MGNLDLDKRSAAEPADCELSGVMQALLVNLIKSGNLHGVGLPNWPAYRACSNYQIRRIDVKSEAEPEPHRDLSLALDALSAKQ